MIPMRVEVRLGSIALAAAGVIAALAGAATGDGAATTGAPPVADVDAACATTNPYFATSFFSRGNQLAEPAVKAFRDSLNNSGHVTLATQRQVGATWGHAYAAGERALYVAAYHKRGTRFGPGGPGAIYRIDLMTGGVAEWARVPEPGPDRHEASAATGPDVKARDFVGVTSLGDIDITPDGRELFVSNLYTRRIYRFRVPDATLLGHIEHGAAGEPWASDARLFGLKVHGGRLYHAVVDSAYATQALGDLEARVYASNLDGSDMRLVNRFGLAYERGWGFYIRAGTRDLEISANWQPWKDGYNTTGPDRNGLRLLDNAYPQPMLSDIEFTDGGDMVLAIRDRFGDMGYNGLNDLGAPNERPAVGVGDIVISRHDAATGTWVTSPAPEFYRHDAGPGLHEELSIHNETSYGGLARVLRMDAVVMTALDPESNYAGGAIWFDNATGGDLVREDLYRAEDLRMFGKANGLGDLEVLCGGGDVPTPTASASATDGPPTATGTGVATATVTARSTATPTATPTDVLTSTPSATATASVTPTATPHVIYLPMAEKSKPCESDAYRTDVVLVLDRSTSMLRSVEPGGVAKNEAAIAAARAFVGLLDLEPNRLGKFDQVAVVGFNDAAWIETELTNDREAALGALERIRGKTQEGTRLDLAFAWGQKPLEGPGRRVENRAVVIVLTDGLPNRVPFGAGSAYPGSQRQEDSVLAAAEAVKAAGTRVYTIGLGSPRDILPWLMIAGASEREMYYYAPRPEELAGIYARIAQTFDGCNPAPVKPRCVPDELHADVVLVIDMSTSMHRETRSGRTKHEAALEAARGFAGQLDLELDGWGRQDQLGVVGFNDVAWTAIGLSSDGPAIEGAIGGLLGRVAEGTRLDLALAEGQAVLGKGPRLQPNVPVVVLLTDGLPNRVPVGPGGTQEETVLAVAAAVKAKGTQVYAIGLGEADDVLRPLLEGVASRPDMYRYAPDGEDLAAIYREIAGRLQACDG